jgi:hypothetical protein
MSDTSSVGRRPYVSPSIRDHGDLVEMTATIGGGLSDVAQGSPQGNGCTAPASCFS